MRRCRNRKGQFTKCRGRRSYAEYADYADYADFGRKRSGARRGKGRCLKWSRGRTRCMKRAKR